MSPTVYTPSKPTGSEPVPSGTLAYFQVRNRQRLYELVLGEFLKSGITQADLARRLRKAPEIVCRLLGAPGNWGIDTVSDFLFAISGAEASFEISYPLDGNRRNYPHPDWVIGPVRYPSSLERGDVLNIKTISKPASGRPADITHSKEIEILTEAVS